MQEKMVGNSQFEKLDSIKKWVGFKSCSTFAIFSILLSGWDVIIYIFFPQQMFEVKFSIKFFIIPEVRD